MSNFYIFPNTHVRSPVVSKYGFHQCKIFAMLDDIWQLTDEIDDKISRH